jgi:hypothetical protein
MESDKKRRRRRQKVSEERGTRKTVRRRVLFLDFFIETDNLNLIIVGYELKCSFLTLLISINLFICFFKIGHKQTSQKGKLQKRRAKI